MKVAASACFPLSASLLPPPTSHPAGTEPESEGNVASVVELWGQTERGQIPDPPLSCWVAVS